METHQGSAALEPKYKTGAIIGVAVIFIVLTVVAVVELKANVYPSYTESNYEIKGT